MIRTSENQVRYLSQAIQLEEAVNPAILRTTMLTISVTIIAFTIWSGFTNINEVARTPGEVVPSGYQQVVQHLEGQRLQCIAGQDRGGFVELPVAARPTATEIVIIHHRQVIVDQGVAMDELDRRGDARGGRRGNAEQCGAGEHKERPQALAGSQRTVAHRLEQARFRTITGGQKPVRRSGYTLTILQKLPDGRWVLARDANLMTAEA